MMEKVYDVAERKIAEYVQNGVLNLKEGANFLRGFVIAYSKSIQGKELLESDIERDVEERIDNAILLAIRGGITEERHIGGLGVIAGLMKIEEVDVERASKDFTKYLDLFMRGALRNRESIELLDFFAKEPGYLKYMLGFKEGGSVMSLDEAEMSYDVLRRGKGLFISALKQAKQLRNSDKTLSLMQFKLAVKITDRLITQGGELRPEYANMLLKRKGDLDAVAREMIRTVKREEVIKEFKNKAGELVEYLRRIDNIRRRRRRINRESTTAVARKEEKDNLNNRTAVRMKL